MSLPQSSTAPTSLKEPVPLEKILSEHSFLLLDGSLINSGDNLARDLYLARYPTQLARLEYSIEKLLNVSAMYLSYNEEYRKFHFIPEVQAELGEFARHL